MNLMTIHRGDVTGITSGIKFECVFDRNVNKKKKNVTIVIK